MMNLNSEFLDSEVFSFLSRSFQSLHPIYWWERKNFPSGLMRWEVVQAEIPIWIPIIWYSRKVIRITELSSVATGEALTYFYLRGFRKTPEAPIERGSEISVHGSAFKNSPPGRFSWPVLMRNLEQREHYSKNIAMVITSVLYDISRVLKCSSPEVLPSAIMRFTFSVADSE